MAFVSFVGRVVFVSVFVLSAWQEFNEFGSDGGPAAKYLTPKLNVFSRNFESLTGLDFPKIEILHIVAGAIALKGLGSLLFIFNSSIGAFLLILHQAITAPILYDFYNYDVEKKEFNQLFVKFTQNKRRKDSKVEYLQKAPSRTKKMATAAGDRDPAEKLPINNAYDRQRELKCLDESKLGVKGLVDSGLTKLPKIFLHQNQSPSSSSSTGAAPHPGDSNFTIPIIDLQSTTQNPQSRSTTIHQIRAASENWGFFQILNHGIPSSLTTEMLAGIRRFHEQDDEQKKQFYSRDYSKKVLYNTNFDLYQAPVTNWRDTLTCVIAPRGAESKDLPSVCRDITLNYTKRVLELGRIVFELVSEALGLDPNRLNEMGCGSGLVVFGHYYPACPEPDLAVGTSDHSDSSFLTVLLQDQIGGLQVRHGDRWVDVRPMEGALVINIGDMLQLISNGRVKSVNHRVMAKSEGPRISVACFFRYHLPPESELKVYGPINELVSVDNPAVYKQTTIKNFVSHYYNKGLNGVSALQHFKL